MAAYRTNGHVLLSHFANRFATAGEPLVWPHHFDEGVLIPMKFEDEKLVSSIGIGLAVPDTYYDHPYFYVNTWSKDGVDYSQLPDVSKPGLWHTREWTGQVLIGKELTGLRREAQAETAFRFMEQAIQNALELITA